MSSKIRSIVIPKDDTSYDMLLKMMPVGATFSSSVHKAVESYVDKQIISRDQKNIPNLFDMPIEDVVSWLDIHPEHWLHIYKKTSQIKNLTQNRMEKHGSKILG
jgi:hypothetical protein